MSEIRWQKALDAYHEQHEEILTDGDARSAAMFSIDESDEKTAHVWHVHQIFADEDGDHDFGIMGDVDLDATQDGGEVIFKNYRVGFIEVRLRRRLRRQVSYSCSILKVWISVMRRQNLYLVLPESVMNIWNFYPRSVRFWKMKKFLKK